MRKDLDMDEIMVCRTTKWCVWSGPRRECVDVDSKCPECYDPACPLCGGVCEPRKVNNES